MLEDVRKVDIVDDATTQGVACGLLLFDGWKGGPKNTGIGLQTAHHLLYLRHSRLVSFAISELLVVGQRRTHIVVGSERVAIEEIAIAQAIEVVRLLVVIAHIESLLVVFYCLVVLLQIEMALGIDVVVDGPFVRSKGLQLRDNRVEELARLLVIPIVVVANGEESTEARVQLVTVVEFVEEQQCLMELPTLEILDGFSEQFRVAGLLVVRCSPRQHAQTKGKGDDSEQGSPHSSPV